MAVSIGFTLRIGAESRGHLRLALQARASSRGKGRCNRVSFRLRLCLFPKSFPRVPSADARVEDFLFTRLTA